jgi:hypothetical protein
MAMMEAVLSSSLHHPNVIQVYTYMLSPLMAPNTAASSSTTSRQGSFTAAQQQQQQQQGGAAAASGAPDRQEHIPGWQLQLVMELADQVNISGSGACPDCLGHFWGIWVWGGCPVSVVGKWVGPQEEQEIPQQPPRLYLDSACLPVCVLPLSEAAWDFFFLPAISLACAPSDCVHVCVCICVQGTLREQLDRRALPHLQHSSSLHPAVAVALSHDIAAAMLHLHKEGIV